MAIGTRGTDEAASSTRPVEARILVVDDEPHIVELLAGSLRYTGFDVTTASNGYDALRFAHETRPDLLVLDVMMPGLDGFEVVRRLSSEETDAPSSS